jgi:hypothetical protein
MNTVFARAFVALSLALLPASALASSKAPTKHSSVAKKDPTTKKKGKHHGHKSTSAKTDSVASHPSKDAPAPAKAP